MHIYLISDTMTKLFPPWNCSLKPKVQPNYRTLGNPKLSNSL